MGTPLHISHEDRLRGILREWRKAQADPKLHVPCTLALLIEAAALALSDQDARYADNMSRLDAERRHTGDAANDRTTHGTLLRPGA